MIRDEQVKVHTENSKDNIAFWDVMRKRLRKSQRRPNISLTTWQKHFETLLQNPRFTDTATD